jgi:ubiquinone/menaquinone biosynthesis C-methylase UbiE
MFLDPRGSSLVTAWTFQPFRSINDSIVMISAMQMAKLAAQNFIGPQTLGRVPEPDLVMAVQQNVDEFDEIINSNVAISFCGALELLFEIGALPRAEKILDLACGPGHFSLFLAKYSSAEKVIGVDLSEPMLEKAHRNAVKMGLSHRVEFVLGDITALPQFQDQQFDLITCTNSAHHLPTVDALHQMLAEMERLTSSGGTAFVMDLTRLRTASCAEKYVQLMGQEYLASGLHRLYEDFRNSMYAAWTPDELRSGVPSTRTHQWQYFAVAPLPINQFLFALPRSSKAETSNTGFHWPSTEPPVRDDLQIDYKNYRRALFASYRWFRQNLSG